jgi:heterotetrameric sarcosine oxidase gamma subunit
MAEVRLDRSALARHRHGGDFPAGDAAAGVALSERWPLAILQIDRLPGPPAGRSVAEQILELHPLLQIGPNRWLVVDHRDRLDGLATSLKHAASMGFAVTDLSQARTVLRIAGHKARDVLAKACALDLYPSIFPVGACAATSVSGLAAMLIAVDDTPTYDLYVPRTYGQYAWEWLCKAAAEYGYHPASG